MKKLFILVLVFCSLVGFGQGVGQGFTPSLGAAAGAVDSTRLRKDSIQVYYRDGVEVGRDTVRVRGGGGGISEADAREIVGDSLPLERAAREAAISAEIVARKASIFAVRPEEFGAVANDAISDRAAIIAAIQSAKGRPVLFSAGTYIVEAGNIAFDSIHLVGELLPVVNSDTTALVGGSVIQGGGFFSGSNITIENLGFDRGSANFVSGDGLKISGGGENIRLKNVIAIGVSSSVGHAILVEGVTGFYCDNITGNLGQFGIALKVKNAAGTGLISVGSQTGIIIKSDIGFGATRDAIFSNLSVRGTDETAHGLRILAESSNVENVTIQGLSVTNSDRAITVETAATYTTDQLSISNANADSIRLFGIVSSGNSKWSLNNTSLKNVFSRSGQILDGELLINVFKSSPAAGALTADNFRVESAVDKFTASNFDLLGTGYTLFANNSSALNTYANVNAKITGPGAIVTPGFSSENVDDGIINPVFSEAGVSTVKISASANVTITSIAVSSDSRTDWPEGYVIRISPISAFTFTFQNNSNIRNRKASVPISQNQTISYVWLGSSWHQLTEDSNSLTGILSLDSGNASVFAGITPGTNNTGLNNTGFGRNAMNGGNTGGGSTALGSGPLSACTNCVDVTALGLNAFVSGTTATSSVIVGANAGRYTNGNGTITSMTNSTFIGQDSRSLTSTPVNEHVFGKGGRGQGNNTVTFVNTSITDNYFYGHINLNSKQVKGAADATTPTALTTKQQMEAAIAAAVPTILTATATLDFPEVATANSSDLTINVAGAVVGRPVILGGPLAPSGTDYNAQVTAAGVVTVRFYNHAAGATDPASAAFTVKVLN